MKIKRQSVTQIVIESLAVDIGTKTVHVTRTTTDGNTPRVSVDCIVHHRDSGMESITTEESIEVIRAAQAWSA